MHFSMIGTEYLVVVLILGSVIFGFLRANTFPAMIFMGDSGSYFIGYSYAVISLVAINNHSLPFWAPILLLGVPIIDMSVVFFKRLLSGKNVFMPDRSHIHFRITGIKDSHKNTVFLLYSIQAVLSMLTLGLINGFNIWFIITICIIALLTLQQIVLILAVDLNKFRMKQDVYGEIFRKIPILDKIYIFFFLALLCCISWYQIANAPIVGHKGVIMAFVALVTAYLFILDKNVGRTSNVSIGMILLSALSLIISQLGHVQISFNNFELVLWGLLILGVIFALPGMFKQHNIFDSPTEFLLIIVLLLSTLQPTVTFSNVTGYLVLILFVVYKILLQSDWVRKYNVIYVINIITLSAIIVKSLAHN